MVREKDMECHANLQAVPKLQANFVLPGNCKQNVRVALPFFDPYTITTLKHYVADNEDSA